MINDTLSYVVYVVAFEASLEMLEKDLLADSGNADLCLLREPGQLVILRSDYLPLRQGITPVEEEEWIWFADKTLLRSDDRARIYVFAAAAKKTSFSTNSNRRCKGACSCLTASVYSPEGSAFGLARL